MPKSFRRLAAAAIVAPLAVVISTGPAEAYLDPGTGSMILQVLLGGLAGAAVVLKLYWQKVKGLVGLGGPRQTVIDDDGDDAAR